MSELETKHYLANGTVPDAREALEWASETRAKMVDLKFCDLFGTWQHCTYPLEYFLEGAAVAALLHQAVQLGLGWYLSGPADFSKVYGSASAIFAFLFSVYLSASAFVIGAILTAVLDEQYVPRRSIA